MGDVKRRARSKQINITEIHFDTEYICPTCGEPLVFFEDQGVFFGCKNCEKFIRIKYSEIWRNFVRGKKLKWDKLMRELYLRYIDDEG